jgi:hypothetical protein
MAVLWALGVAYFFFVLAMGIAKWHASWGMAHLGSQPTATVVPATAPDWES